MPDPDLPSSGGPVARAVQPAPDRLPPGRRHGGEPPRNELAPLAVRFLVLNIPADRLPEMKKRAQAKGFNFPYLHDPSQKVGRAYRATVRRLHRAPPAVFVFDRKGRRAGKFDTDDPDKGFKYEDVENLVQGLLKESP